MASIINVIEKGWSFAQVKEGVEGEYADIEKTPTSVHAELIKSGMIPDPYKGMNEYDVQWVGESDWQFKVSFSTTKEELDLPSHDLVLDGLDTFCRVELNGVFFFFTTNMFLSHRVPIPKKLLKNAGEANELKFFFESAWLRGKKEEAENGGPMGLWNGDSSRLYVRKAQYGYGWDWGLVLMTVGVWKPVFIEHYMSRISDVRVDADVAENLSVSVEVTVAVEGEAAGAVVVALKDPAGAVVKSGEAKNGKIAWTFKTGELDLWYPVHYGEQPIYSVEVTLLGTKVSTPLATRITKTGFRRARVVQEPLDGQPGTSFLFEINNVRVFCGGANWIPADAMLTNITNDRYRAWLDLMVEGNQNMVRVWAGGIYEADVFYEHCDKIGLLVWQDFMFGCGQYPAHDKFIASIKLEAEQVVTRLRDHPSVVIFAGNNEDYQVAESLKLELDYSDENPENFRKTNFPARYIYEKTLPDAVNTLSSIFYHRGSPYGGKDTTDRTVGDLHQWNVWHGTQEPWTKWDQLSGRFVSEFGMEGFANIRTVDWFLDGNKKERFPQSRTVMSHNKADGSERRLALYLIENFRFSFEMESFIYATQVMQSDTLASAYRLWRREWRGRGKEYTAGALVWQINDDWPTTSWAIVDYFLRPKPAYFTIKRELATYTVGLARKEVTTYRDKTTAAFLEIDQEMQIWGTNSTLEDKEAVLEVRAIGLDGNVINETRKNVTLAANSSTEFFKGPVPGQVIRKLISEEPKVIVVGVRLLTPEGEVLARYSDWPMPYKYICYDEDYKPLKITVDGEKVTLEANAPVKGVVLDAAGEDAKWSDQCLDIMPGDVQVVTAVGLKGREVQVRYIGDGTA
ncbi:glycoside hydrolase family 2 protein [Mrakia frigida]|uniref:beta-mannosidase n=1 Tax=Mrakia frigida TaxID=29902 RepID=UPI003FCC15B1